MPIIVQYNDSWSINKWHAKSIYHSEHSSGTEISFLTAFSIENPLVHLINDPEETEVCLTGKENVKPSAFCSSFPSSLSTKSFSAKATKLNSSCGRTRYQRHTRNTLYIRNRKLYEITSTSIVPLVNSSGMGSSTFRLVTTDPAPTSTLNALKFVPPRSMA